MLRNLLFIITVFSFAQLSAQEFNFQISINTPQLQTVDPKVFQDLKGQLQDFLNNQKWTEHDYQPEERIQCNISLNITKELSPTTFEGDLNIQAVRPVYGSSYETPLMTHVDKSVQFEYEQFQPLQYIKNSYSDNLSAVLSFYVYMILGMDYDSFSPFGGETYYQTALEIINAVPPGAKDQYDGWKPGRVNRNRYWMVDNLLSPSVRPYRQAMYDYHRQGLDLMANDPNTGRAIIANAISEVEKVEKTNPNLMIVDMFVSAKRNEIVDIFSGGSQQEKSKIRTTMTKIDAPNANTYRRGLGR